MLFRLCHIALLLFAMFDQVEELPDQHVKRKKAERPTLGGTQFWTDQLVCQGWRIQRNVKFGQFRLLRPNNRVAKTGTHAKCQQAFRSVFQQPDFPQIPSTVVVSVHGLGRTRNSMSEIGKYVSDEGDFGWVNFGYASTRGEISDHARALRKVLDTLTSLKHEQEVNAGTAKGKQHGIEFHFVAHSLGNIVVRNMLSDIERNDADGQRTEWQVGRMVMLGPPNHGSALANLLRKSNVFRLIAGSSGKDLGAKWEELQERLITPKIEFSIIAGGKGDEKGFNPLLAGDDDLIVRVDETKLSGAVDFTVVPCIHTKLMNHSKSKEMTLRFLQMGFLKSAEERTRIP